MKVRSRAKSDWSISKSEVPSSGNTSTVHSSRRGVWSLCVPVQSSFEAAGSVMRGIYLLFRGVRYAAESPFGGVYFTRNFLKIYLCDLRCTYLTTRSVRYSNAILRCIKHLGTIGTHSNSGVSYTAKSLLCSPRFKCETHWDFFFKFTRGTWQSIK